MSTMQSNDNNVELVKKLVNKLSTERADEYNTWMDVGSCLHSINSNELLPVWTYFSMKSCKFLIGECEREWDKMDDDGFDISSLKMWAEQDDSMGYGMKIEKPDPSFVGWFEEGRLDKEEVSFLLNALDYGEFGMSEIVHKLFKDTIRCVSPRKYYYFDENKTIWVSCDKVCLLYSTIFSRVLDVLNALVSITPSEEHKSLIKRKMDTIRSPKGMSKIMSAAGPLFDTPDFYNQLDCFPYLLGVRNGVVDLRNGTLRSRLPQDMIYHVCDVEYDPGAPTDLIESVVKSLMADDLEMVDYIQKLLGYAISGEKKEEIFVILAGTGENDGKSILTEMLRLILGSMYVKKTNSKNANVKSNRVVEYKELIKSGKIRFDVVTKATDNDGTPIMNANLKPNLSNAGFSITERIVCIPFPVKFIELEPGEKPSLYKRQRNTDVIAMLRADLAGVFNWLVQGSVRWYASQDLRRSMPTKVRNSSASLFV